MYSTAIVIFGLLYFCWHDPNIHCVAISPSCNSPIGILVKHIKQQSMHANALKKKQKNIRSYSFPHKSGQIALRDFQQTHPVSDILFSSLILNVFHSQMPFWTKVTCIATFDCEWAGLFLIPRHLVIAPSWLEGGMPERGCKSWLTLNYLALERIMSLLEVPVLLFIDRLCVFLHEVQQSTNTSWVTDINVT